MTTLHDTLLLPAQLPAQTIASSWQPEQVEHPSHAIDRGELTAIYAQHAPSIHRFACDLLGDATLASDATQETFVRAFHRLDSLDDLANVGPWLFGIARNVSRELRKARTRARRTFVAEPHQISEPLVSTGTSPEGELLDREAVSVVGAALGGLSYDRRAVLLLRLDHGLAYEQIASLMGWSLAKVKVEIFRAREQLRAVMLQYEGGVR